MESTTVEVEAEGAGKRLDRYLADRLGISRARVRHLLEFGRVEQAGRALGLSDKSMATTAGDRFEVLGTLRAEDEQPTPRPDLPLEIVASGEGWLVVDKPAGCGVHPLRPDQEDTVLNAVLARHPEILGVGEGGLRSGVVHRLDVDTTGALAFATDAPLWKRLRGAFAEHRVAKRYCALVAGRFESAGGARTAGRAEGAGGPDVARGADSGRARRVDLSLAVTRHQPAHVSVQPGGTACRMRVRPVEVFADATLVEVELETGFLHQIRASMAHLGHPVVGDVEYGGPTEIASLAVSRPLLHAAHLAVDEIRVDVPLPADFEAILEALRSA